MFKYIIALFCMLFSTSVYAHSIKAEDLEKFCTASTDTERNLCTLIVKVYMDGFIEGVAKGAIDTYKYDPQVLALVGDAKMKDLAPRINKVVKISTCIQQVSVSEMTKTYMDFIRKNPSMRQDHYRKAMTRAIVSRYCKK